MKQSRPLIATACLLLVLTSFASAEALKPRHGGHPPHPPIPVLEVLDANKDGVISAEEIANASAALKTLDANNDGKLDPQEFLPPPPPEGACPPPPDGDE